MLEGDKNYGKKKQNRVEGVGMPFGGGNAGCRIMVRFI